ncbi:MAG: SCP-like extracellular [Ruminococcus sp.]|nr:SCP-like extracellular [Ruminococcus sp.]
MNKFRNISLRALSVMLSAIISAALLFFIPADTSADTDADLNAMAEEIILLVNEARTEAGLRPLRAVPYLNDVANVRARECIFNFDHYRPNGDLFITALDDSLVPYSMAAENIAAGSFTAKDTFAQWKRSLNHWKSIMNPEYTHIGVGVAYDQNSEYQFYWEQFFVACDTQLPEQYIPERVKTVPVGTGDINGDSEINGFDIITICRYLEGDIELNELQFESADILKDGEITSADVMLLQKYILGDCKTIPITIDMILSGN